MRRKVKLMPWRFSKSFRQYIPAIKVSIGRGLILHNRVNRMARHRCNCIFLLNIQITEVGGNALARGPGREAADFWPTLMDTRIQWLHVAWH